MKVTCKFLLLILAVTATEAISGQSRSVERGGEFAGSATCAGCHREIYDDFRKTSMGRSFGAVTPAWKTWLPGSAEVAAKTPGRSYRVSWEGGTLFQSETYPDDRGKRVTGLRLPVEYVVGSGENGYSFLVRRGEFLFEAPVSYYSRSRNWDLSPGFDSFDAGFSRPIRISCLECHVGRFGPNVQGPDHFPDRPFAEAAIGCESCHGAGKSHVLAQGAPETIVNPAKLSFALAANICLRCHQGNDARILQPGKTSADFRPGAWLGQTVTIFKVPLVRDKDAPESDLLEHGFAMALSKCYRSSKAMSCITCHSVHETVEPLRKTEYYRSKCLTCHASDSCRVDPAKRQPDDCVSCHMPKRAVQTIAHTALTNHRIVRKAGEPYPEIAYSDSGNQSPGLIHVTAAPIAANVRVPEVVLLQAYRQLLLKAPTLRPYYVALLDRLQVEEPDNPVVLAAAGHERLLRGDAAGLELAASLLNKAVRRGEADVDTSLDLADALARERKFDEASRVLNQALIRNPYAPELYRALIPVTLKAGNGGEALKMLEAYLRLYPADAAMRRMLEEVRNIQ